MARTIWTDVGAHQETGARTVWTDLGAHQETAGSVAYTLTATGGSFTISGTAASLEYGRLLTAAAGSYAITGTDATLTYGQVGAYTLAADAGSYAITGTAATLTYAPLNNYTLTADPGAFSIDGIAATLIYSGAAVQPTVATGGGKGSKDRRARRGKKQRLILPNGAHIWAYPDEIPALLAQFTAETRTPLEEVNPGPIASTEAELRDPEPRQEAPDPYPELIAEAKAKAEAALAVIQDTARDAAMADAAKRLARRRKTKRLLLL